jgi:hypothetical protein
MEKLAAQRESQLDQRVGAERLFKYPLNST